MWFRLLRREVELARDAELGLVTEEAGADGEAPGSDDPDEHRDQAPGSRAQATS